MFANLTLWQLCTYHWGLISNSRTTYEDIKNTRRHFPGGVEPTRLENCKAFFASVQRPSYVGSDSGLLAASGGIDMQELAQQKEDYMHALDVFNGAPQHQGQTQDNDDALHNPLPL